MLVLVWWSYPLIAVTVFVSMVISYRYQEMREQKNGGGAFRPCLSRLDTGDYCGDTEGHTDPCGALVIVAEEPYDGEDESE